MTEIQVVIMREKCIKMYLCGFFFFESEEKILLKNCNTKMTGNNFELN